MDNSQTTVTVTPASDGRWLKRITGKSLGEIATDLTLFVMGVAVLFSLDFFVISHGAPVALRYLIDLLVYLNQHAAAAIEIFN
ncbi:MAG: hypothetical protein ACLQU2_17045 [Candidatus Binataceae bacterium]